MQANDKIFNEKLERISKLYEDGKDAINAMIFPVSEEDRHNNMEKAFNCLQQLRDIAATQLKQIHET